MCRGICGIPWRGLIKFREAAFSEEVTLQLSIADIQVGDPHVMRSRSGLGKAACVVLNSEVVGNWWIIGRSEEVTGGEDPIITGPCHAVRSLDSMIGTEEGSVVKRVDRRMERTCQS